MPAELKCICCTIFLQIFQNLLMRSFKLHFYCCLAELLFLSFWANNSKFFFFFSTSDLKPSINFLVSCRIFNTSSLYLSNSCLAFGFSLSSSFFLFLFLLAILSHFILFIISIIIFPYRPPPFSKKLARCWYALRHVSFLKF